MGMIVQIASDLWNLIAEMAPYLLFGFLISGVLSVFVSPGLVERHLGGRGIWPVVKASLFGIPLPLCSCGVIPVAASLRRHGAGKGASTAFLLSTPQTGVDSIMVTFSLLGPVFAVFRPFAALVTGVIGGSLTDIVEGRSGDVSSEKCTRECCNPKMQSGNRLMRVLRYGFVTLPGDIGKAMLIGLVVAAVISVLVPDDFFQGALGTGFGAMLMMMLLGIPIYVCATASVPIAAAMILKGVSPGAAFVFLMTGPATNAAAIATIWKVLGRRSAVVYLATVAVCSLLLGLGLDFLYESGGIEPRLMGHDMLPDWVKSVCSVVLLGVLGFALFKGHDHSHAEEDGQHDGGITFKVKGMTCSHCAESVRKAVAECEGVESVHVSLAEKSVVVWGDKPDMEQVIKAIAELGYEVHGEDKNENAD